MNWYSIFYWLTVADNAKDFFWFFAIIFSLIAVISIICYFVYSYNEATSDARQSRKWFFWSFPFMMLLWMGIIFTPSKRDALLIIAGGGTMEFLSNDSTAKEIPHDMLNFVQVELKAMALEAKVEILDAKNEFTQRQIEDRIREEAKKLTTDELLLKMQKDKEFARIVMGGL